MKTKKFNKKLALNKKTIARLDNQEMEHFKGGAVRRTIRPCWLYETHEFHTCDCSYYC